MSARGAISCLQYEPDNLDGSKYSDSGLTPYAAAKLYLWVHLPSVMWYSGQDDEDDSRMT